MSDPDPLAENIAAARTRLQDGPEPDALVGLYRRYLNGYEQQLTFKLQLLALGQTFKISGAGQ